jgi:putative transposase
MATLQRIPLGGKHEHKRIELPDHVQVCLGELAGRVREGLLAFSVGVGLEVLHALLEEDAGAIVGERGRWNPDRSAYRHGTQTSSLALGGRKVAVERPRVRSVSGEEIHLPAWAAFAGHDPLAALAFERMVAGLSTRRYKVGLEPVGEVSGSATSRSAVSRRFVERTRQALVELMAKDLSEQAICALFIDGENVGDHTVVVALGVDREGNKHPLGLREGTTESEAVCRGLLSDLVDRGLDFSAGILLVIDGAKGLRKAVREVFGSLGLVQRCRIHKRKNMMDHLPRRPAPRFVASWSGHGASRIPTRHCGHSRPSPASSKSVTPEPPRRFGKEWRRPSQSPGSGFPRRSPRHSSPRIPSSR